MEVNYFKIPEIRVSYKDRVRTSNRFQVRGTKDAVLILRKAYEECMQHHEETHVLFLNNDNRVLGISYISKCGITETVVDMRIIMQTALKVQATKMIFSHNHPSGTTKPSCGDISFTKRLREACDFFNICLLDHIIITAESYYSFVEDGIL